MKHHLWLLALSALVCASPASAQRRTTIGFETTCNGTPVTVDQFNGSSDYPSSLYAPCGISSAVTGESQNMRIGGPGTFTTVPNVFGANALAGAMNSSNPSTLTVTFVPAVNELSFQVLGLANNNYTSLTIQVSDANGGAIATDVGTAPVGGRVGYSRVSTRPITTLFIKFTQNPFLTTKWFIDQLSFNAWVCGDGELENTNGATESCDDGNNAQCDGCTTSCTPSAAGCFDGTSCIAPGMVTACSTCDMSKPPNANGDVPVTPSPVGTGCNDNLKCTQNDACDGSGRCVGSARSCDDATTCTLDTCSEAAATADGCGHSISAHTCLIGNGCFNELTTNPINPCQQCDPTRSNTTWSGQAKTVRCGMPMCIGDQFTPAALCDGEGSCVQGTPMSCAGFACTSTTSCTDSCVDDRECVVGKHCDKTSMKCVSDQTLGAPCTTNTQCGSGLACADGVCCDSACGSRCETCNAPGFVGKCVNITFGDPDNECAEGSSCRAGNQCVQDSIIVPPGDAGVIIVTPDAGPGVLPVGAVCSGDQACGLGFCRDGVCCASACNGTCEGCNVLGSTPGQCTAYSLGTDPENECAGVSGVCGGENACTFFETRGNGLCSPLPGQPGNAKYALSLVALALAWAWRRRRAARSPL